jgi:hypothetical protein
MSERLSVVVVGCVITDTAEDAESAALRPRRTPPVPPVPVGVTKPDHVSYLPATCITPFRLSTL